MSEVLRPRFHFCEFWHLPACWLTGLSPVASLNYKLQLMMHKKADESDHKRRTKIPELRENGLSSAELYVCC